MILKAAFEKVFAYLFYYHADCFFFKLINAKYLDECSRENKNETTKKN